MLAKRAISNTTVSRGNITAACVDLFGRHRLLLFMGEMLRLPVASRLRALVLRELGAQGNAQAQIETLRGRVERHHAFDLFQLEDAELVVCAGLGIATQENWDKLNELSTLLQGAVGYTHSIIHRFQIR